MYRMMGNTLPVHDELADLKSKFLACLNHEIRTPLNGILGLTAVLLEDELKDEQRECAQSIKTCAESLFAVLHATLEYSALSAGKAVLDESEFRIEELFQSVIAEYVPKAKVKNLSLSFECESFLPETAIGDAIRIRQVFCHLLDNAIKFTPTGRVEVLIHTGGEQKAGILQLHVEVRDSGIGIPPDRQEAIFEAFRQLDTGLARQFSGLGLGLALAQKMVQLLGGSMSIDSALGKGSTFAFVVPVLSATQKQAPKSEVRNAIAARVGSGSVQFPRVLVVEDNQVAQRIVSSTLTKRNYRVVSALSGPEAIMHVTSGVFDLILMDLQMPGMDGIEAASRIRELENGKSIPVVAFTANATAEYREICRKAGFDGFLAKPVNTSELLSTVEQFCGTLASLAS